MHHKVHGKVSLMLVGQGVALALSGVVLALQISLVQAHGPAPSVMSEKIFSEAAIVQDETANQELILLE